MWLRLRWQNLSNELLLFEQSGNLKKFVVVIFVLALKCSPYYNLSSQPELYLPFRTLIQHLHIKAICILKISSPNFHVIIYCIYMTKIEQIRKIPCLSLHDIDSLYTLNTWEMYIWCFNTCTWISHAISENSSGLACRQGPWSAVLGYFHACVKWTYILMADCPTFWVCKTGVIFNHWRITQTSKEGAAILKSWCSEMPFLVFWENNFCLKYLLNQLPFLCLFLFARCQVQVIFFYILRGFFLRFLDIRFS